MEHYEKAETHRYNGPPEPHEVRVASRHSTKDIIQRAKQLLKEEEHQQVLLSGQGPTVVKATSCAEIIKRQHPDLHQVTSIQRARVEEIWKPKDSSQGLDDLKVERQIPAISILLCCAAPDPSTPGYQAPSEDTRPGHQGGKAKRTKTEGGSGGGGGKSKRKPKDSSKERTQEKSKERPKEGKERPKDGHKDGHKDGPKDGPKERPEET
eukprot:scpid79457/ scgid1361/ Ribonuclease P protein subunit p25-like protein; Rpp25-like protein